MTDEEFQTKWKQMEFDTNYLCFVKEWSLSISKDSLYRVTDSLAFACKMIRVYERNLRAAIKSNVDLRRENKRLKAYIKQKEYMNEDH